MAVTAAAAHVTVGFFLQAVDGSLLCSLELQGDREANWVEFCLDTETPRLVEHYHVTHLSLRCYTPWMPEKTKTNL